MHKVKNIRRRGLGWFSVALIGAGMLALPGTVAAKDGDVIRRGDCTRATDWKLKLSPENGRIEVEFEVDSNVNGQTWEVQLNRNGNVFFQGTRTTQAPSGSFEVRRLTANGPGTDRFAAAAVNRATGETCRGTASF
jgi:hypothetical protein